MGKSGSGKGTQAQLLKSYLENKGVHNVHHITTGGAFREFIQSDSYPSALTKEITNSGRLLPEFLAVWNWSNIFIKLLQGDETIIFDGAPRRIVEVEALHSAIAFFGYVKPIVIYLDVTEHFAMQNITTRGREDDKQVVEQERKMSWFEQDVLPCIESYKNDPRYSYIHVNGEQEIDAVYNEMIEKIESSLASSN